MEGKGQLWQDLKLEQRRETGLTLNSSTHEYKIQGLSSLTTYTIDVAAVTAAGAGVPTSSTISSGVPPGQYARAPVSQWPCPLGLALAPSW